MKKLFMVLITIFMFTGTLFADTAFISTKRISEAPLLEKMLDQVRDTNFTFMVGSETSDTVTAETDVMTFRAPYAFTILGVRANVKTAPSADMTIDINDGGTTIFGNYVNSVGSTVRNVLVIPSGSETSKDVYLSTTPTGSAYVITDSEIADDAEITVDVDSTTGGAGLRVTFYGRITALPSNY